VTVNSQLPKSGLSICFCVLNPDLMACWCEDLNKSGLSTCFSVLNPDLMV